jgi:hypothetical protein
MKTCYVNGCNAPAESISNDPECGVPDPRPACAKHAHTKLVERACDACDASATVWITRPIGRMIESHVWCDSCASEHYASGDTAIALPLDPLAEHPLIDITARVRMLRILEHAAQ